MSYIIMSVGFVYITMKIGFVAEMWMIYAAVMSGHQTLNKFLSLKYGADKNTSNESSNDGTPK
jgi:hypothetical protein